MSDSSLKYRVFENEFESDSQPEIYDIYPTNRIKLEKIKEVSMKRKLELWKQLKYKDGIVYYCNNGKIYNGTEIKRLICKEGRYRYHGYLKNGKLNGKGMHYYKSKEIKYMGDLVDGMAHGYGVKYKKGRVLEYRGEFQNNYFHGKGQKYKYYGIIYEGEFDSGEFEGHGILFHSNRKIAYKGSFENGKCNGYGEYYDSKGRLKYKGMFYNNMFHGEGFYYNNKKILQGVFENDTFKGKKFYKKKMHFWEIFS